MAWIKMRTDLKSDIDVLRIAKRINTDVYSVIGMLHTFWAWADQNTDTGTLPGISPDDIDDIIVGRSGFAGALESCGWLSFDGDSVTIPGFETHMSDSAKKRALDLKRKQRQRDDVTHEGGQDGQVCPNSVRDLSGSERDTIPDSVTHEGGQKRDQRKSKNKRKRTRNYAKNNISLQRDVTRELCTRHFRQINSGDWKALRLIFISLSQNADAYADGSSTDDSDLATSILAWCIEREVPAATVGAVLKRASAPGIENSFGYAVNALKEECESVELSATA